MRNIGKYLLLIIIIILEFNISRADSIPVVDADTSFVLKNFDYLHNSWIVKCCNKQISSEKKVNLNKNDLKAAIENLPGFNYFYTKGIYDFVNIYLNTPRRQSFSEAAAIFYTKQKTIQEAIKRAGLISDWQYFPLAASAFYPLAKSPDGAYGYWHFYLTQAQYYGLKITSLIDERKDLSASTDAAIKYILRLKNIYKKPDLTLMAFILKPTVLNKKIREANGSKDIKDLYPLLNKQQQDLYNNFVACAYLLQNKTVLHLKIEPIQHPINRDKVSFHLNVSFSTISQLSKIGMDTLTLLNPTYRAKIVPKGMPLFVPQGYGIFISNHIDSILAYQKAIFNSGISILNKDTTDSEAQTETEKNITRHYDTKTPRGKKKIIYSVKTGDNMIGIAQKYHVSVSQIKKWNHLHSHRIYQGQKLNIYVTQTEPIKSRNHHHHDYHIKKTRKGTVIYTISSGESLYTIAKKFPGVSAQNIMKYNHISANVKPGQKVKIPPSGYK